LNFKRMICVGAAVVGVTATAVASASAATTITENGSSLVYPLVSQWKTAYASQGSISPTSSSSGTGIDLIQTNAVNIGASDAPMTSSQYAGDSHSPTQIPWALSATGVGYNIPGVGSGLKLNAAILVGIYNGTITKWNNSAIVKLNPKLKKALGKAPAITAVVRTGGSGDTYAFQHFLSVADPKGWTAGYSTNWLGTGHTVAENGNSGVAGEVRSNPGAIGYISAYYLMPLRTRLGPLSFQPPRTSRTPLSRTRRSRHRVPVSPACRSCTRARSTRRRTRSQPTPTRSSTVARATSRRSSHS